MVDTAMEFAKVSVYTEDASGVSRSHDQSEEIERPDIGAAAATTVDGGKDGAHLGVDDSPETTENFMGEGTNDTGTEGTPEEEETLCKVLLNKLRIRASRTKIYPQVDCCW